MINFKIKINKLKIIKMVKYKIIKKIKTLLFKTNNLYNRINNKLIVII